MKLVVVFTLFALAAARVDVSSFEPIHSGPEIVDFEPESAIASIDKDTVRAMLRKLLERIASLRPQAVDDFEPIHVGPAVVDGFEPIHVGPALVDLVDPEVSITSIEDLKELIRDLFNKFWPEDRPRPTLDSIEKIIQFLLEELRKLPLIAIRDFFRTLFLRVWPNGVSSESLKDVLEYVRNLYKELFPNGFPRPPKPTPDTLDSVIQWVLDNMQRFPPGTLDKIRDLISKLLDRWPENAPGVPGLGSSWQDFRDFIREIIEYIKSKHTVQPETLPTPPAPSSPLVQIIVNVKSPTSNVVAPPAPVEVEPTPVIIVEDAKEDVIDPVVVEEAEDGVIDPVIIESEPVIVAPGLALPVVVAPDTLD